MKKIRKKCDRYSSFPSLIGMFLCLAVCAVFFQPAFAYTDNKSLFKDHGEYSIKYGNDALKVIVAKQDNKTDIEGRIEKACKYYFLKFRYKDNFFSINMPDFVYENMDLPRMEELVNYVLSVYDKAFDVTEDIFPSFPRGYRLNITFGKTASGDAFNRVYSGNKNSNIFINAIPYEETNTVLSEREEQIFIHEIAHSFFGIFIGNIRDPRFKSFEEGFCDYFSERINGKMEFPNISIRKDQFDNMDGLAQLDIDNSIWGEDAVSKILTVKGYGGVTHHIFGLQFIHAFIETFGSYDLVEFMERVKAVEDEPYEEDLGSRQILRILHIMGYNDDQVDDFRRRLYRRLGENVFHVE